MPRPSLAPTSALCALALLLAGCGDDGPTGPGEQPAPTATITADASQDWAHVDLGNPATVRAVADPTTSTEWDLALNQTQVQLNNGDNGPGGVVAYCLCQNQPSTSEQVLAMTAEGELADFEAVDAADVPPASDPRWSVDAFDANKWYRYNLTGSHGIHPTFDVYLVRRGSEVYKVQLINYYGPAGETRRITMRYARLAG